MGNICNIILLKLIAISVSFYVEDTTLPIGLYQHQIGYNNKTSTVYLFGGALNGYSAYSNTIYKRDLSNSTMLWHPITVNTSTDIFVSWVQSSVTIDDLVYFVGIQNGSKLINQVIVFNLTSERFIDPGIPTYPYPAWSGCITTNGTHIFMVGGTTDYNSKFLNYIQILNVNTHKWTNTTIDIKFWGQSCALVGDTIYVFSGINEMSVPINTIYKYNVFTSDWTFVDNISVTVGNGNAVYSSIDNNIYVHGYNMIVFSVEKEEIIYEEQMYLKVKESRMIIYNDTLMIFGGFYAFVKLSVTGYQCTSLVQAVKLPLTKHDMSCSNSKAVLELNTVWIIVIMMIFVTIIIICNLLSVYFYKKRFIDDGQMNNNADNILQNDNDDNIPQNDNNDNMYRRVDSEGQLIQR